MKKIPWHSLSLFKIYQRLKVDPRKGLSEKEVFKRREKFGENKLPQKKPPSKFSLFLSQFKSPLIYILIFAGIVVIFLEPPPQNLIEGSFIFLAILINGLFGFWEENKSFNIFLKLKKILKTKAIVKREGKKKEIFKEEIVPGDIFFLKPGFRIPADGRLIEVKNLKVNEAILTGEWLPEEKKKGILPLKTPLGERKNMVFSGTLVADGYGKAIAVATGIQTEIGKIYHLLEKIDERKTPLERKLEGFCKLLTWLISLISFLIFLEGLLKGKNPLEIFETSIAIAVGAIPEALPVIMTLTLALGMEKLAKRKGLIRKLEAVETLGSITVICVDKTKTLTLGKMEVEKIIDFQKSYRLGKDKGKVLELALKIASLANESSIENPQDHFKKWKILGSPTDKALLLASAKEGFLKPELEKEYKLVDEFPFDSSYKFEAKLTRRKNDFYLFLSGAPEILIERAEKVQTEKDILKLDKRKKEILFKKLDKLTEKGWRVIGLAFKKIRKEEIKKDFKEMAKGLVFVAFISLRDPLRKDSRSAMKMIKKAGINPVIITGDHKKTAKAIAEELGFKIKDENILEGAQIDELTDEELERIIPQIKIFARAEPHHKLKIVKAWQKRGQIVAMTGDGVNDAPALAKADVGVALGSAVEVAKESADLVLLNDSFSTLKKAIEQGRVILDNIRKAIAYVIADAFTSVILIGASLLLGWPLPILWTQILWNNLVEDTFPNIAFAFEPKEKDIMKRKPNPPKAPLLTREMKVLMFLTGFIDQLLALIFFWFLYFKLGFSLAYSRTMTFGVICVDTAFVIYCYKSFRKNIWNYQISSNKFLLLASFLVFFLFALAIYLPIFQKILHTVPLGIGSWLILIGMGFLSMLLIEITKYYFIIKRQRKGEPKIVISS